jgi:hypothetical protein
MKKLFLLFGAFIIFCSCSTEDPVPTTLMLGGSSQAPVFLNCRALSDDVVEFEFSQPVKVTSLKFDPVLEIAAVEDGSTVRVKFDESPQPGTMITADLLAEDAKKNTINVLIPFRSRNNRMPSVVINELRTEYSNTSGKTRNEFIELKTKTAGNLGAMRVFLAGGSQKPTVYEFAPVEVRENEFVVLHLRKIEENCKDEYTDNLEESGGFDSSPAARDFWIPGTTKLINKAAGFVYVLDQDDNVLSAIMHSETQATWWAKDYLAEAAEFLFLQDAWKSADGGICTPADAIKSSGTTATRTICRDETLANTNTAADWYITDTSGATPGNENNPKRYVPKK